MIRTVAHLARKDARRFAGALALWLALVPLVPALFVALAAGRFADLPINFEWPLSIGNMLLRGAGLLLAAQIAMEDPPRSENAAWKTRPIRPGELLAAKAVVVFGGFAVAPTVLLIPVWLAAGFTAGDMAVLAVDGLLSSGLVAGLGLLLGAISRTSGQALGWLGAALVLAIALPFQLGQNAWQSAPARAGLALACCAGGLLFAYARRGRNWALLAWLPAVGLAIAATLCPEPFPMTRWHDASVQLRLVPGTEQRIGSIRHRVVRQGKPRDNTPGSGPLWVETTWRELAPIGSVFARSPGAGHSGYLVYAADGTPLNPASSQTAGFNAGGVRLVRRSLVFNATDIETATWRAETALAESR